MCLDIFWCCLHETIRANYANFDIWILSECCSHQNLKRQKRLHYHPCPRCQAQVQLQMKVKWRSGEGLEGQSYVWVVALKLSNGFIILNVLIKLYCQWGRWRRMRLSGDKCKNKWLSLSLSIRTRGLRSTHRKWLSGLEYPWLVTSQTESYKHGMYDIIDKPQSKVQVPIRVQSPKYPMDHLIPYAGHLSKDKWQFSKEIIP